MTVGFKFTCMFLCILLFFIIPKEEYFSSTLIFVKNYKEMSTSGLAPKHCIGFSYIHSGGYELDILWLK